MVTVAQLVEPWTVTPVVAGSNPVSHPIFLLSVQYSQIIAFLVNLAGGDSIPKALVARLPIG